MRRQCGRPGCSARATTTFTFDATRLVVWLNPLADGTARAGDLCTRHADALAPPQGWERVDRRPKVGPEAGTALARAPRGTGARSAARARDDLLPQRRKRRARWAEVPTLFAEPDQPAEAIEVADVAVVGMRDTRAAALPPQPTATPPAATAEGEPAWMPRFTDDDDLDGLLRADTPLLARAFRTDAPGSAEGSSA